MAREPAIDARVIGSTVKIEVCKKVERKFRQKSTDTMSTIYARALEESVREVRLTAQDYMDIAHEIEHNREKRENKRENERKNRK